MAGQGIMAMLAEGRILFGLALLAAVVAWIAVMLVARKWLRRNRPQEGGDA
jgi:hypothetical protein